MLTIRQNSAILNNLGTLRNSMLRKLGTNFCNHSIIQKYYQQNGNHYFEAIIFSRKCHSMNCFSQILHSTQYCTIKEFIKEQYTFQLNNYLWNYYAQKDSIVHTKYRGWECGGGEGSCQVCNKNEYQNLIEAGMQALRCKWVITTTKFLQHSSPYLMAEFLKFIKAKNTIKMQWRKSAVCGAALAAMEFIPRIDQRLWHLCKDAAITFQLFKSRNNKVYLLFLSKNFLNTLSYLNNDRHLNSMQMFQKKELLPRIDQLRLHLQWKIKFLQ